MLPVQPLRARLRRLELLTGRIQRRALENYEERGRPLFKLLLDEHAGLLRRRIRVGKLPVRTFSKNGAATTLTPNSTIHTPMTTHRKRYENLPNASNIVATPA